MNPHASRWDVEQPVKEKHMKLHVALVTADGRKDVTVVEVSKAQSRGRPVSPVYVYVTKEQLDDLSLQLDSLSEEEAE